MRILMLTQFYPPIVGGEERHVRNLAAKLAARGHSVNVMTMWYPGSPEYEMDGEVGVHRVRGSFQRFAGLFKEHERRHAPPFPDPELVAALSRLIRKLNPDVVHAHNWIFASFLPLKRWSKARLVVTLHDYSLICAKKNLMYEGTVCAGPSLSKCWQCAGDHYGVVKGAVTTLGNFNNGYYARRTVDKFIAVSHAVARDNRLSETGVPFEVIQNFVPDDISIVSEEMDPCLLNLPTVAYILFVGDMTHVKGADILLKAYATLDRAPPLVMIGRPSPDIPSEIPQNVHLLGPWRHDAIMHAWKRCLFGVAPSVGPEACATVVMEGMASGKSIIASDIGGMPDMIDAGVTGILVPPDNVNVLAEALQGLLNNRDMMNDLGIAALAGVERLKATPIVSRIEQVYESVLHAGVRGEAA
jgi:glycosyltransferase involved in cell wall biosynthesis